MKRRFSRREFLRRSGALAGGAALGSALSAIRARGRATTTTT